MQEFITGGDLLANGLYVLLFLAWTVSAASRSDVAPWKAVLPAALLGIGLSSRANMVFLLPLVFFAITYSGGLRSAVRSMIATCAAFFVVTAPFYLYDPGGFTPLQTTNRFAQFDSMIPFVGVAVPLLTGVLALLLSLWHENGNLQVLLGNCAITFVFPILFAVFLSSIKASGAELTLAAYGIPFLVFGCAACWVGLFKQRSRQTDRHKLPGG